MKNIGLYISIIALVGVILLFVDRLSNKNQKSRTETKFEAQFAGNEKIAFVNIDSLVDSYDYYNELKSSMMQKQENLSVDLEARYKNLQRKAMELQTKVEQRMMTPTTAQSEQQKLMQQEQQIMVDKQNLELQLAEENQKLTIQILDSVKNYLTLINKERSYSLILSSNVIGGTVITSAEGKDLTSEVIKGLNERFRKSKGLSTEKQKSESKNK